MEADWSVLLTADFELDVVAGASFVGPAGSVPIGLMGVVGVMDAVGEIGLVIYVLSDIVGAFGAEKSSFLQPTSTTEMSNALSRRFDFFMFDSC